MKIKNNKSLQVRANQTIAKIFIATILFLSYPLVACGNDNNPPPIDDGKLPTGVFCLDGMRWEHYCDTWEKWRATENIYDAEGNLIKTIGNYIQF